MVLPRKTILRETVMPEHWDLDKDPCGLTLLIENEPAASAWWNDAEDFGFRRPAISFLTTEGVNAGRSFEILISRLARAFDRIPSRYPLYIRLHRDQLSLIATASRMGFQPYFGSWKEQSADQSEHNWTRITSCLRQLFPQGLRAN